MAATDVHHGAESATAEDKAAMVVAAVLVPVAIYVAFWVLHFGAFAGLGFVVMVPSAFGSTVAALIRAAQR